LTKSFDTKIARWLAYEATSYSQLEELDLSRCSIDIHGLIYLFQGKFKLTLRKLNVEKNLIVGQLDQLLTFTKEMPLLVRLNLSLNQVQWQHKKHSVSEVGDDRVCTVLVKPKLSIRISLHE
jgi:hypothetical protein